MVNPRDIAGERKKKKKKTEKKKKKIKKSRKERKQISEGFYKQAANKKLNERKIEEHIFSIKSL